MKWLRKNSLIILSFLLMTSVLEYGCYQYIKNDIKTNRSLEIHQQECISKKDTSVECKLYLNLETHNSSFFEMLNEVALKVGYFGMISFLLLLIPSIFYTCQHFKNKVPLLELNREKYSTFIWRIIKKNYSYLLILLASILIMILTCYGYTTMFGKGVISKSIFWSDETIRVPIVFLLLYLFNIVIHGGIFLNIGLCVCRKVHNFFLAILYSFLSFIGIQLFFEIVLNGIIGYQILKVPYGSMLNLMNIMVFQDQYGVGTLLGINFFWFLISCGCVFLFYRKKENFIIDCESNK